MTNNYEILLKEREELNKKIEAERKKEKNTAIAQAKAIITKYELSEYEVFPRRAKRNDSAIRAKYRDSVTGATWTGRGKPPLWIAGKDRNLYLIKN